jgi:hypothetical protein
MLIDAVSVTRPAGRGRPRMRLEHLTADKAYGSRGIADRCARAGSRTPSRNVMTFWPDVPGVASAVDDRRSELPPL